MSITSISVHSLSGNSAVGSIPPAPTDRSQPGPNPQSSATVTLSEQAQKLSQSHSQPNQTQTGLIQNNQPQTSNTVNTTASPNAVPQSATTNAAPGIQFMSGERKTGRVNTFA
jgi:hypothetical protein